MYTKTFAYDTETTGLDKYGDCEMFGFSTCSFDGETEVQRVDGSALRQHKGRKRVEMIWDDRRRKVAKAMHNAKFDLTFTERYLDRPLAEEHQFHDTIIQSHILQNHHPNHRLKQVCWELCEYPTDDEAAIKPYLGGGNTYQDVPEHLMTQYQHRDAERAMLLHRTFYPKIQENSEWMEIYQTEMDLIRATIQMEKRGVMLDPQKCEKLIKQLQIDVREVKQEFARVSKDVCGVKLDLSKVDQLRYFIFKGLKLPVLELTETKLASTKKEVLLELRERFPHPALELIMKYRSWSRGATMIAGYMDKAGSDYIIHPDINTCKAVTSRESCSNPNLHNVEKTGVLLNPYPVASRTVFRPRPGFVNFHIDYSGIELRLLVHYSDDKRMIEEINRPGGDVHALAASVFYGRRFTRLHKEDPMWTTLRNAAKNANFAIPYGAAAFKVAATLGIPIKDGMRAFEQYKDIFPGLCGLTQKIIEEVNEYGYVKTAFGRRLFVPRDLAYTGTNYKVQGTAAGVIKRAQNRVHRYIIDNGLTGDLNLLLPVHDEIIGELRRTLLKDLPEIFRDIRKLMIDFPQFKVPLDVELEIATVDWAHKTKIEIPA